MVRPLRKAVFTLARDVVSGARVVAYLSPSPLNAVLHCIGRRFFVVLTVPGEAALLP